MPEIAASALFGIRNFKKSEADPPRFFIAAGQVANATKEAAKLDNVFGKTTKSAVDVLEKASKQQKVLEYAGKGLKFVGDNVNPLLCVFSGIKILNADDKQSALITEVGSMSAMFVAENMMTKHMGKITEIKGVDNIAKKVMDYSSQSKAKGMIPTIIKGVAFVAGSITAYKLGEKAGKFVAAELKPENAKKEASEE